MWKFLSVPIEFIPFNGFVFSTAHLQPLLRFTSNTISVACGTVIHIFYMLYYPLDYVMMIP